MRPRLSVHREGLGGNNIERLPLRDLLSQCPADRLVDVVVWASGSIPTLPRGGGSTGFCLACDAALEHHREQLLAHLSGLRVLLDGVPIDRSSTLGIRT